MEKDTGASAGENYVTLYNQVMAVDRPVSFIYNFLLSTNKNNVLLAHYYHLFIRKIKEDVSIEECSKAFLNIKKIMHMVKLRDFQYRLLCNAVFANDRLFYWKKVNSQFCDICNQSVKQTTYHMLYDCITVRKIWINMHQFIKKIVQTLILMY